ncbi:nucleotidyltransferase substrate binding protein [Methylomarinum sp. Ch1-1]|uniref:Nucleotidyltransferase substrate binding protein n=1 Tax=Methylomarinum roseum TaxID=3067653 RepID=A0AAU7NV38_9GAMM|nr:nucleotidyltransferase substrate binding protein [Methylomarinum sp. Ch1-1]MDP4519462.1 nucleotidyltransferase substrate binding protein [Methylomarinum sp. Ch1-1]
MEQDVRWKQRFSNFEKAFLQLKQAVETYDDNADAIIKEGIIQRFEFTHELAWKVMKDFLEYEGYQNITGSRSATRGAFNIDLLENGQAWMDMIESRNRTVHTYQESILEQEYKKVSGPYFYCFSNFYEKMKTLL